MTELQSLLYIIITRILRKGNNKRREKTPTQDLPRRIQHIVDKDTVTAGGVIYEDVSDRANELSVLDDRTATHE